jgi:hypothetical protein
MSQINANGINHPWSEPLEEPDQQLHHKFTWCIEFFDWPGKGYCEESVEPEDLEKEIQGIINLKLTANLRLVCEEVWE